ncbi:uncharacterized protein LOC131530253 [Onychostoma macrolepis]|uniref:uncharacterized protein LOC131530253 n=1 Tax=Onychostoma macrolepis TaxID=369639 RepID=UPI00272D37E3|nr:uncharacterized protein LOC131530253 [Onychostoma macrolepis]
MQTTLLLSLFSLLVKGVLGGADKMETVSVIEGDSVTLNTDLTEIKNDDTILWMFGPRGFVISQITRKADLTSFFVTDDAGFRDRLQVNQETGSLTIRNSRIRHSGQYKLSISREKTTMKIFSVTVTGVVGETGGVKSVTVTEGQNVTLNTDTEIHLDDLILWRFGDKGILLAKLDVGTKETSLNKADERFRDRLQLNQNGSLTIKNTSIEHAGLYELQIRGHESFQRFLLSVTVTKMSVMEGDSLTLLTDVEELQKDDEIQWWYEDEPNPIAKISKETNEPSTSDGTDGRFTNKLELDRQTGNLKINNIRILHTGLYKFKISNKIRTIEKRFIVTVQIEKNNVSEMEGDSPTLSTGVPELQKDDKIQWYYEDETNPIAEINTVTNETVLHDGTDGRFRNKLTLDSQTGNLTIKNIRTLHSGLYKLKITSSSSDSTKYKRFIVRVKVRTKSVEEGDSVSLEMDAVIQTGDLILWTFGAENCLIKTNSRTTDTDERFRDRLKLDEKNGSLAIKNITTNDAGHYHVQIINSKQTIFRRFNVIVTEKQEHKKPISLTQEEEHVDLHEMQEMGSNE